MLQTITVRLICSKILWLQSISSFSSQRHRQIRIHFSNKNFIPQTPLSDTNKWKGKRQFYTFPNPQAQSGSTLPPNSENNASSKSSPPQPPRLHQHHHQHHRGGFHGAKHQLAHRAREKISMKFAEKMVSNVLPRLVKRTGKHLGPRIILTKLGRGLAIAIPAVGGLFAAFITTVDFRRMRKESQLGSVAAARAFGVATVFDIVDCLAHIFTAICLSGKLSIWTEHHLHHYIHTSETVSIIAAIIATTAAITGEFLSLRVVPHSPLETKDEQRQHNTDNQHVKRTSENEHKGQLSSEVESTADPKLETVLTHNKKQNTPKELEQNQ